MAKWRPQPYRRRGRELEVDPATLDNAIAASNAVVAVDPLLPPVLTLRHLAYLTDTNYALSRNIVSRNTIEPYQVFRIRKRPSEAGEKRYRIICAPEPSLMRTQRWIAQQILPRGRPHHASVAFADNSIYAAAKSHCNCRWMIKMDVRNFFESISEISVYRVFRKLGYQPLPAFELTRVCTRLGSLTRRRRRPQWRTHDPSVFAIGAYRHIRLGHLPQGAPTSPMLANLAVHKFDELVDAIAVRYGLVYTRYADDLALSTRDPKFNRRLARAAIGQIYAAMGQCGLSPNFTKTRVCPPGTRRISLGLLVDGPEPRLNREFKARLRQHLYYLRRTDVGPAAHARKRGFAAIAGLRHHVQGLIAFAGQIEPVYAAKLTAEFAKVQWPV